MTNILVLSDLDWGNTTSYLNRDHIDKYKALILEHNPELILFAGDLIEIKDVGINSFCELLVFLEEKKICSAYIWGNHDFQNDIEKFESRISNLTMCHDINGKEIELCGIKILGLSFNDTNSKRVLKKRIKTEKDSKFDIVLAHCENKRRPYLFNFDANLIITGHFDNKLFRFNNSTYLSLPNDSIDRVHYSTICYPFEISYQYRKTKISLEYKLSLVNAKDKFYIGNCQEDLSLIEKLKMKDFRGKNENDDFSKFYHLLGSVMGVLDWKFLRGKEYIRMLEYLLLDDEMVNSNSAVYSDLIDTEYLQGYFITKSMLNDYKGFKK